MFNSKIPSCLVLLYSVTLTYKSCFNLTVYDTEENGSDMQNENPADNASSNSLVAGGAEQNTSEEGRVNYIKISFVYDVIIL